MASRSLHADDYLYSLDIENSVQPPRLLVADLIARVGSIEAACSLSLDETLIHPPAEDGEAPDRSHYPPGLCDREEYICVQYLRYAQRTGLDWHMLPDEYIPVVNSIALSRCVYTKGMPREELDIPAGKYRCSHGFRWAHNSWDSCISYLMETAAASKHRKQQGKNRPCTIEVGVHNLSYEGSFLIPWLFEHGYHFADDGADHTFDLITDGQKIYMLTICQQVGDWPCKLRMVCTLCMTGQKLEAAAGRKGYNLPTKKAAGDLDYSIFREMWREDITETFDQREIGYITADVDSTVELLRYLRYTGFDSLTAGSHALKTLCLHSIYGLYTGEDCPEDMEGAVEYERRVKAWARDNKYSLNKAKRECLSAVIRKLTAEEDELMRLAYDGGFVEANPTYKGAWVDTRNYDVNSEYPAAMALYPCPGSYRLEPGNAREGLYINYFTVTRLRLKPGKPPMLPSGGSWFGQGKRLYDSGEMCPDYVDPDSFPRHKGQRAMGYWALCTYDFEHMWECYDVEGYTPIFCYRFNTMWYHPLKNFVNCYYALKAYHHTTGEGALRNMDKLQLNSSYGKLASRFTREEYAPEMADGALAFAKTPETSEAGINVAMGLFVTAAARDILYKGIQGVGWPNVAYCDTDSMKVISPDRSKVCPDLEQRFTCHDTRLGAFKFEGATRSCFIGPKQYVLITPAWVKHRDKLTRTAPGRYILTDELTYAEPEIETGAAGYDKSYIGSMGDKYRIQEYAWSHASVRARGGRCIIPFVKHRTLPHII